MPARASDCRLLERVQREGLRRPWGPRRAEQGDRPAPPGDTLIVTGLDRLAALYERLAQRHGGHHPRGAGFRSLKDSRADTARTGEGRERAKARGVRFGRPQKLSPHQRREAIARLRAGKTVMEIARTFGVDRATVYRLQP
jgi:DNA invertase Pin-like site-specific DNA recombinase